MSWINDDACRRVAGRGYGVGGAVPVSVPRGADVVAAGGVLRVALVSVLGAFGTLAACRFAGFMLRLATRPVVFLTMPPWRWYHWIIFVGFFLLILWGLGVLR